jgi:hypothetical protein
MSGPKPWSRVLGTVYGIQRNDEKTLILRRPKIGYVGMTAQRWEERIRQHLYGSSHYQSKPKPWADLVPGYPGGLKTVLDEGGAFIIWQGRCFYWWLKLRESWAIAKYRPPFNIQENLSNSRHVPKWDQVSQRKLRDRARLTEDSRVFARIHRDNVDSQWERWIA